MNRLIYNRAIIDKLKQIIEKYPDWRFGQLLTNVGIITGSYLDGNKAVVSDPFYVELETMWNNMINNKICFPNE